MKFKVKTNIGHNYEIKKQSHDTLDHDYEIKSEIIRVHFLS